MELEENIPISTPITSRSREKGRDKKDKHVKEAKNLLEIWHKDSLLEQIRGETKGENKQRIQETTLTMLSTLSSKEVTAGENNQDKRVKKLFMDCLCALMGALMKEKRYEDGLRIVRLMQRSGIIERYHRTYFDVLLMDACGEYKKASRKSLDLIKWSKSRPYNGDNRGVTQSGVVFPSKGFYDMLRWKRILQKHRNGMTSVDYLNEDIESMITSLDEVTCKREMRDDGSNENTVVKSNNTKNANKKNKKKKNGNTTIVNGEKSLSEREEESRLRLLLSVETYRVAWIIKMNFRFVDRDSEISFLRKRLSGMGNCVTSKTNLFLLDCVLKRYDETTLKKILEAFVLGVKRYTADDSVREVLRDSEKFDRLEFFMIALSSYIDSVSSRFRSGLSNEEIPQEISAFMLEVCNKALEERYFPTCPMSYSSFRNQTVLDLMNPFKKMYQMGIGDRSIVSSSGKTFRVVSRFLCWQSEYFNMFLSKKNFPLEYGEYGSERIVMEDIGNKNLSCIMDFLHKFGSMDPGIIDENTLVDLYDLCDKYLLVDMKKFIEERYTKKLKTSKRKRRTTGIAETSLGNNDDGGREKEMMMMRKKKKKEEENAKYQ